MSANDKSSKENAGSDSGQAGEQPHHPAGNPGGDGTRRIVPAGKAGRSEDTDVTDIIRPGERSESMEDSSQPVPGRIGRYSIKGEVGRGGMGVVYEALDPALERKLAIKVLTSAGHRSEEDRERFRREAEASANLSHPNIVPIHEFGDSDGLQYYTMDYIQGHSLKEIIEHGVPPVQAAEIVEQLARAAHFAHKKGVIHRDMKPGNVIVDEEGLPRIMDFGLAKFKHRGADLTGEGVVVGTPLYMSPEQAQGRTDTVDERSDIYSLGAILYEMLAGSPPFQHENQYKLLRLIAERDPVPPRKRGARIHRDLETICLKCLEKAPEKRYQTALALAEDLRAFLNGEHIRARPVSRLWRFARRLRPFYDAIAVGLLAAVVIAGLWVHYTRKIEERERRSRFGWTEAYNAGFDGDVIPPEWRAGNGRWWVDGGRLYGTGEGNTYIYLDREFAGDVRVEVRCRSRGSEVGVSILGTETDPVDGGYFLSLRSGAGKISKQGATILGDSGIKIPSDRELTVVAERQGQWVRVFAERLPEARMEFQDPLPVGGPEHSVVALYTFSGTLEVDSVTVYRVAWPEETSPLKLAEQFLRNGKYSSAFDLYVGAATNAKDPDIAVQALFGAARSVEEKGDFEKAAQYYLILRENEQAAEHPRIREKALFRAIRCFLASGNREQAEEFIAIAEKEHAVSDEWRILVAFHMEEAEASRRRYRVLRNEPGFRPDEPEPWGAHNARAEVLLSRIQTPAVRKDAARALARTYMERGTQEDLLRAVRLDPENALIQIRVSETYLERGDARSALVHAERAAAQGGQTKEVRIALGDALFALGRYREALVQYDAACGMDPLFIKSHTKRAVTLYMLGRSTDAARVVREHAANKEAFLPYGLLMLAEARSPLGAVNFFLPVEKAGPVRSAETLRNVELVLHSVSTLAVLVSVMDAGQREEAVERLEKILRRIPELPEHFRERTARLLEAATNGPGPLMETADRELLSDPIVEAFLARRGFKTRKSGESRR